MHLMIFVCAWLAFTLSALCGGGAGLLLIPLLGAVLSVAQVPVALTLGTTVSSVSRLVVLRGSVRWDVVRQFVPTALPATLLGAALLGTINPIFLKLAMGLSLVANLPALLRRHEPEPVPLKPVFLRLIGAAAGFISGLTGAVGVLFNGFYLRCGMKKEELVATRAANEVGMHLLKLVCYLGLGLLTPQVLLLGSLVAVAAVLSSASLGPLLLRVRTGFVRRLGYATMVWCGLGMLTGACLELPQTCGWESELALYGNRIETRLGDYSLELKPTSFEAERRVAWTQLPDSQRAKARELGLNPGETLFEVVVEPGGRSYEAAVVRQSRVMAKYRL